MNWRLLVLAAIGAAAPQPSVSGWTSAKGVDSRELRFTDKAGEPEVSFLYRTLVVEAAGAPQLG